MPVTACAWSVPGVFLNLLVGYVGTDQVKLELTGGDGSTLTKRVNIGSDLAIGEDVKVRVVSINFRNVKLGFDAPLSVKIVRTELLERAQPAGVN